MKLLVCVFACVRLSGYPPIWYHDTIKCRQCGEKICFLGGAIKCCGSAKDIHIAAMALVWWWCLEDQLIWWQGMISLAKISSYLLHLWAKSSAGSHLNFSILFLLPNFGHFVLFKFALKIFTGKVLSRNTKVEIANRVIRSNCVIPRNAVGDGTYTAVKHDEGFLYLFEVSSHPTLGKHQKLCN